MYGLMREQIKIIVIRISDKFLVVLSHSPGSSFLLSLQQCSSWNKWEFVFDLWTEREAGRDLPCTHTAHFALAYSI